MNPQNSQHRKIAFRPEPRFAPESGALPRPHAAHFGLLAEIEIVGALLQRVFRFASAAELEPEQWSGLLTGLASACTRLAGSLAGRRSKEAQDGRAALERALKAIALELKQNEP